MVVGVQSFEITIPGAESLKAKRSVVKSLKDRMRRRFNVSVAETARQDRRDRAEVTVAVVAHGRGDADAVLDRIDAFVAGDPRLVLGPVRREFR